MIDYSNELEEMVITCDFCEDESVYTGEWIDCLHEAKQMGWKVLRNVKEEWIHKCPSCARGTKVFQ